MSEPLSKEAEARLVSAIQNINSDYLHGPMTAEALKSAAVKSAREYGFGPDMIRLLCAGYNTGATLAQREASSTILQKHAAFPLADAEEIIREIYPKVTAEKLAAERSVDYTISDEYVRQPRNPTKVAEAVAYKQAEYVTIPLAEPTAKGEEDFNRLLGQAQRLSTEIKSARYDTMEAEELLLNAVHKLSGYFKHASHHRDWSFGEVKYAAVRRFGKVGELVMKCVSEVNRYDVAPELQPRRPVLWDSAPFTLLQDCVKQANAVDKARDRHVKVAVANRRKIADIMAPYRKQPVKQSADSEPASVLKKQAAGPSSGAVNFAVVSGALKNLLGDYVKPKATGDLVQGRVHELADPDHEEALRRIRAQSMLQSFLTDDPILSGHNPDEVMRHFNELSQMSPRAAQQPAIARSVLRRWSTQGAIEPFEAKEITDLEKNLNVTQGRISPPTAGTEEKAANVLCRKQRSVMA